MARGIGALNVSVNAETRQAIANLKSFAHEARMTGKAVRDAGRDFQGNSIGDFESRFARGARAMASQRDAALKNFRSASVDLSRDSDRYRNLGREVGGVSTAMGALSKTMRFVSFASRALTFVGVAASITQLVVSAARGRKGLEDLGNSLARLTRLDRLAPKFLDGLDVDAIAKRSQELDQKLKHAEAARQRAEEKRRAEADRFNSARFNAQRSGLVAQFGEGAVQLREDEKEFGFAKALQLQEDRNQSANHELRTAAARRREEERIAALKERTVRWEQAQQEKQRKLQENHRQDLEAVERLKRQNVDFWKTNLQRERDELLRTIEDPRLRNEARWQFDLFGEHQRNKQNERLRREAGRQTLSALDPLSREGNAQRVRTLNQTDRTKWAEKQVASGELSARTLVEIKQMLASRGQFLLSANL
jgi:hypothetical protein